MLKVRLTTTTVSDGTQISIPQHGVVLLVGPNNAGKSQFLRDILGLTRNASDYRSKVLTDVAFAKESDEDVEHWISANLPRVTRDGVSRLLVEGWGEVGPSDFVSQWVGGVPTALGYLTSLFVLHADGSKRLTAGDSQDNIDFSTQLPQHPLQTAYIRPELEAELSQAAKSAFGTAVAVDRYGGSKILLRIGEPPALSSTNGIPTESYLNALKTLPRLEDQGDGVRSYLGLLLHMLGGSHQVILVDEPEAFLHPPQARKLGEVLAEWATDKQAVLATHSSSILLGALQADLPTTIIRITRAGDVNHAAVLNDELVKELWSDPLLRYSNLLDGLFHDAVVLCEGNADCRYYAAVLDASKPSADTTVKEPQLLFTHCNGKGRMASAIAALAGANVPVVVVADFDVLKNEVDIKRIYHELGGDFGTIESDWKVLGGALTSDRAPLHRTTLKDELVKQLDALDHEVLDKKDMTKMKSAIHADDGWDKTKRSGTHGVPQGQATAACRRLLRQLAAVGLLVVPVGELERFVPEVGGHGPPWVGEVLTQKLHLQPSAAAESFARSIRDTAARLAGLRPE